MKRMFLLNVAFVALTVQCDWSAMVVVTAPLTRPLPSVCIKSILDTITHSPRTQVAVDSTPPKGARGTLFRLGAGVLYRAEEQYAIEQYEYRDSTAALETWVMRVRGPRYSKSEAESLGNEMGAMLLHVRDACGGASANGSPPYIVRRKG